jgi:hypothetical protein
MLLWSVFFAFTFRKHADFQQKTMKSIVNTILVLIHTNARRALFDCYLQCPICWTRSFHEERELAIIAAISWPAHLLKARTVA